MASAHPTTTLLTPSELSFFFFRFGHSITPASAQAYNSRGKPIQRMRRIHRLYQARQTSIHDNPSLLGFCDRCGRRSDPLNPLHRLLCSSILPTFACPSRCLFFLPAAAPSLLQTTRRIPCIQNHFMYEISLLRMSANSDSQRLRIDARASAVSIATPTARMTNATYSCRVPSGASG